MRQTFVNQKTGEPEEFELVDNQWTPVPKVSPALQDVVGKGGLVGMVAGAAEEGTALASGAKQLYQAFAGDEEGQQKARDEEEQRRALFNELYRGDKPPSASAGGVIPSLLPIGAGAAAATRAPGMAAKLATLLGRAGGAGRAGGLVHGAASTAGGVAGGAIQPTVEEGERSDNMIVGGALGSLIPGVTGATEIIRKLNRMLPEEAEKQLVERLGYGGSRAASTKKLRTALETTKGREKDVTDAGYALASNLGMKARPQTLSNTASALDQASVDLSNDVVLQSNPRIAKLVKTIKGAADEEGKYNFDEIVGARKELSELSRSLKDTGKVQASLRVNKVIDALNEDLKKFDPEVGPGPSSVLSGTDTAYSEKVKPFDKEKVGAFLRQETSSPGQLGEPEVTADLLKRAPSTRGPMRELAGERVSSRKELRFAEALSPEEQEFAARILRGERKSPPWVTKYLPGDWDERLFAGTDPMGYKKRYSNILRAGGAGGTSSYLATRPSTEEE